MELEGPHWKFSLGVYGRAGVAPSCLSLQDEIGVDVNVLLLALHFTCVGGKAMDAGSIAEADRAIREWRRDVVEPLRTVRRRLKDNPLSGGEDHSEAFRQRVKTVELLAEQLEQAALAKWFSGRTTPAGIEPDVAALRSTARAVAAYFAGRRSNIAGNLPPAMIRHAERIADAAHAECTGGG